MFIPGGDFSGPSVDPSSPPTMPSPDSKQSKRGDGSEAAPSNTRVGVETQRQGPAAGPDRYVRSLPKGPLPNGQGAPDSKRIDDPKSRGSSRVRGAPAKPGSARNDASSRVSIDAGAIGSPSRDKGATLAGDAVGSSLPGSGFVAVSTNGGENVSVFVGWNSPRQGAGRLESRARQARRVGEGKRESRVRVDVRDDHRPRHGARRLRTERARAPRVMRSPALAGVTLAAALVAGALLEVARSRGAAYRAASQAVPRRRDRAPAPSAADPGFARRLDLRVRFDRRRRRVGGGIADAIASRIGSSIRAFW